MTRPVLLLALLLAACAPKPAPVVVSSTPVPNPSMQSGVDKKQLDVIHQEIQNTKGQIQNLLDQTPDHK